MLANLWLILTIVTATISINGLLAKPTEELGGIKGRIISGKQAVVGQFPWHVILKRDEWDDLLCGGSIISDSWVLTAAHCAYGYDSLFLLFGTVELNDEQAQNMTATELYVHPNYNDKMNNDVALIRLPRALVFSSNVQAIQLVSSSQAGNTFVGTTGTITGFGLMDDEYLDYSQTLLFAQVEVITNSQCQDMFGAAVVLDSTLCARGYAGSIMSTCSGDSGGPLIIYDSSSSRYVQIGINSFVAEDQCTAGYPSGYVRLTSFLEYIKDTTGLVLS